MNKNKITGLNDWNLIKDIPKNIRKVDARIHFKYPSVKTIQDLSPKERILYIDKKYKEFLKKIVGLGYFDHYVLIGTEKRPTGINVTIPYSMLNHLAKLPYVSSISIHKIEGGKKVPATPVSKSEFYCVKMTVAIEIEGVKKGFQTYEERYVLIKAKSYDDAYNKIEKTKNKYAAPYLNSDGQFVRWKIESLDGCYQTDMVRYNELDESEGIEVYSKLKKRKLTKDRVWDGKL